MVARAQREQVLQLGVASSAPVPQVVSVEIQPIGAASKGAAAVARKQCPTDGRRDGAATAAHVEKLAATADAGHGHRAVAAEPLERLAAEPIA